MIKEDLILLSNEKEGWIAVYRLELCTKDGLPKLIQMTDRIDVLTGKTSLESWMYVKVHNWNSVTNELDVIVSPNNYTLTVSETDWKQSTHQIDSIWSAYCNFELFKNRSSDRLLTRVNNNQEVAECIDCFDHSRMMVKIKFNRNYSSYVQLLQTALDKNDTNIQIIGQDQCALIVLDTRIQQETMEAVITQDERTLLLLRQSIDSQRIVAVDHYLGVVRDLLSDVVLLSSYRSPIKACAALKRNSRLVTFGSNGISLYDAKFNVLDWISYASAGCSSYEREHDDPTVKLYYVDEIDLLIEKSTDCPLRFWTFTDDKIRLICVQTDLGPDVSIEFCWTRINQTRKQTIQSLMTDHVIRPIANLIIDLFESTV